MAVSVTLREKMQYNISLYTGQSHTHKVLDDDINNILPCTCRDSPLTLVHILLHS